MTVESVKLLMDDENISRTPQFWAGPIQRLASSTDVVWLGPNRMVVSHLAGQDVHVLERSDAASDFEIVNTIITTARARPVVTDLMSWHEPSGLLAASNCRVPSASLYRVAGQSIELAGEVRIPVPDPGFTHGVEFTTDGSTLCLVNSGGTCQVRFVEIASGEQRYAFEIEGWRPKDAAFIDDRLLVLPLCDGSPTSAAGENYNSLVALVRVDLEAGEHEILDAAEIPQAHIDGVWHDSGEVFIADQTNDAVKIYRLGDGTLTFERDVTGVVLPHGISVRGDQMAVTSYGDSSLNLMDRSVEHFEPERVYTPIRTEYARRRYRSTLASHAAAADDTDALLSSTRERIEVLEERLRSARASGQRRNDRVASLEDERERLREMLAAARESAASRTNRISSLEEDREVLRTRLDEVRSKLEQKTQRIQTLEAERDKLRDRLGAVRT